MPSIRYLTRNAIDDVKWNACIDNAPNGLIYAKTYYLDALASDWSAVVADDYAIVMPLPFKRKYGIRYVYMPAFVQQLGCFSTIPVAGEVQKQLLLVAQSHFSFGDYHFNYANSHCNFLRRNNYILALNKSYSAIGDNYKTDLKKNLNRTKRYKLVYSSTNNYETVISLFKSTYNDRKLALEESDYHRFINLCSALLQRGELLIRKATDQNNMLLSTALCLKDKNRLYLILSATPKEGRAAGANHFLLDQLIQEFAMQNLVLDFEGSDIEGIAHFYKNFGCVNEPYYFVRWNHLPWPIRLFKKATYNQL